MDEHFDVDGNVLGGAVLGWDAEGNEIVGRHKQHKHCHPHAHHHKAHWRERELAPGVVEHGEGLMILPLTPQQNSGTFTATVTAITWQGQLQKPFRSERLLVSSVRTGTSATGRMLGQIFVGVDLQQAEITGFDTELVGAANSFGTRMTLVQAPPGVLIRIPVVLSQGVTGTDTIFGSFQFLGRVIH